MFLEPFGIGRGDRVCPIVEQIVVRYRSGALRCHRSAPVAVMHVRSLPIARCRITRTFPSVMVISSPTSPRRSLSVERQENDHPLAFGEAAQTRLQAIQIERAVDVRVDIRWFDRERLAEPLATAFAPLEIQCHRPADAQDERGDLVGVANQPAAKLLDGQEHDLLNQIARRFFVTQVTEPVETHPRCESPVELRLGIFGQSAHLRRHCPREIAIG